jgi:C_GCAxxG_C_C family probable redox protein
LGVEPHTADPVRSHLRARRRLSSSAHQRVAVRGGLVEQDQRKRELMTQAYELGFDYERRFRGCSQCVIAAVQDTLGIREDQVFKAATGLSGGGALTGTGACGGLVGGVMVLSQLLGRERPRFDDPDRIRFRTFDIAKRLTDRFQEEFGGTICRDVQSGMFGRSFDLRDREDFQRFEEAGGHEDKCPTVVGKAARMTVEIILDAGLVPDSLKASAPPSSR